VAFEKIVYLHCGATLLQAEIRIGLGLIAVDADLTDIHVHHARNNAAVASPAAVLEMCGSNPSFGLPGVLFRECAPATTLWQLEHCVDPLNDW
jgi:hypothetical protein